MIKNDKQLAIEQEQLARLERILDSYRAELLPKNPRNFELYSEGCVELIDKLKGAIDEYLARNKSPLSDPASAPTTADHPTTAS